MPLPPPPVAAPTSALGPVARVVDTFVAPSRTFADLLRSTSCWLPLVLLVLTGLLFGYVVDRQVGYAQVVETTLKGSPAAQDRINQLPPEQKMPALARQAAVTRALTYGSALPILIFFALYSLVLWATFNFGLGAAARYGQVFAAVVYAALPYAVRSVVAALVLLFGHDAESFDLKNPVGSNLAYYLPDAAPWVRALLQRVDVFELWVLALTILALHLVTRKSMVQSAAVVGGFYLLGTLVAVGLAVAF